MRRTGLAFLALLPRLLLLSGGASGAGCTAAKVQLQIVSAQSALHRAEEYEAQRIAIYEYTMAVQYLDEAVEKANTSDYRIADALARRSAEWSDRAIIFVERRGRQELDLDVLPEAPTAPREERDEPRDDLGLDDELDLDPHPPAPTPR